MTASQHGNEHQASGRTVKRARGESLRAALCRHLAHDPTAVLAEYDVTLRAWPLPLRLPGKVIHGAWDPLLRRIDVYGCNTDCPGAALVESLLHEVWHAVRGCDEIDARRFARRCLRCLSEEDIARCASILTELANQVCDEHAGIYRGTSDITNISMMGWGA